MIGRYPFLLRSRQRGKESRAHAGRRREPYRSSVPLNDPAYQGQPDSFTLSDVGVEAVESREDAVVVGLGNAEAVVLHVEDVHVREPRIRGRA